MADDPGPLGVVGRLGFADGPGDDPVHEGPHLLLAFDGGPVGLSTLAVAVGEEPDTLEDVYEPYLLTEGLIKRTPRGRAATAAAFAHLGLEPPSAGGPALF